MSTGTQAPPPIQPPLASAPQMKEELALSYLDRAKAFNVISPDTRALASNRMVGLKGLIAEARNAFDPIVEKAHAAHKEACAQRSRVIEPLDSACRVLAGKVGEWDLAEQRRRDAEERARLEAAQREADLAREAEIQAAEDAGASVEEIHAICEMPVVPVAVVLPAGAPKSPVSTRANLKGRVTNLAALIAHVSKHPHLANLLTVNESALNAHVKALGASAKIPGVDIYNAAIVTTRTVSRRVAQ